MRRRAQAGFTLIEIVLAMVLLSVMMLLLYSGLSFALRSWDAGDAHGRRTADRRIGENFLRRELTEVFPMRWKDPMAVKLAFSGEAHRLRFVSTRPVGIALGGLALVSVEAEGDARKGERHLVMRRAMPDEAYGTGPSGFVMRSLVERFVDPASRLAAVSLRADLAEGALLLTLELEARPRVEAGP